MYTPRTWYVVLVDGFGRGVIGVRIPLTDRCNFGCVYYHNERLGDIRGPVDASDEEMGTDDMVRFLKVVEEYGVERMRFTDGEPMFHVGLEEMIRWTSDLMEAPPTTDGIFLGDHAEDPVAIGFDRVDVSQDAFDLEAFAQITESGAYDKTTEGTKTAVNADLTPVKLNTVAFMRTAGRVEETVEHIAENPGLRSRFTQYIPELMGKPEWDIDIERVHRWPTDLADKMKIRDMHCRRCYCVGEGMVEIIDPIENPGFCANCHRVCATREGYLKGHLNRNDDLHPTGEMTREDIRETFEVVVENRVPYYDEYLVRDGNDGWTISGEYVGA